MYMPADDYYTAGKMKTLVTVFESALSHKSENNRFQIIEYSELSALRH